MRAWAEMFDAFLSAGPRPAPTPRPTPTPTTSPTSTASPATTGCATCSRHAASGCRTATRPTRPTPDTVCGLGNRKNDAFNVVLAARRRRRPTPARSRCSTCCASMRMPVAVVSSSANAPAVLAAAGLADRFVTVVDGRVATALGLPGKPAPDTFVHAAAELRRHRRRARSSSRTPCRGCGPGAAGAFGLVIGVDRGAGADDARRPPAPTSSSPTSASSSREGRRMHRPVSADPLDRSRFPVDPWRLVERDSDRARPRRHRDPVRRRATATSACAATPRRAATRRSTAPSSTGFHETWPIRHAEEAYGFARTGQTIVNAPDAKLMKLYVDDEPLSSAPPTSSTTSAPSTSATACCGARWSGARRRASGSRSTPPGWSR